MLATRIQAESVVVHEGREVVAAHRDALLECLGKGLASGQILQKRDDCRHT
jgi:hypothetical protein